MLNVVLLLSAVCFWVCNILGIVLITEDIKGDNFNQANWKSLDSTYLAQQWEFRRGLAPLLQASSIFNAAAWLLMLVPILQLTFHLSKGGKRKVGVHTAIASFSIVACFTEVTSRILFFGAWGSASQVSTDFNLDNWVSNGDAMGWKSLEVSWQITYGLLRWIDAFEWICLFAILTLLYFSIGTQSSAQRKLPMWWARLGVIIAFLSIIDFTADLLPLNQYVGFARFSIIVALFNSMIMLPGWLCSLSYYLPEALLKEAVDEEQGRRGKKPTGGQLS